MSDVITSFRALVVSLSGVFLAWLWFSDLAWLAALLSVLLMLGGWLFDRVGTLQLPSRPVLAVRLLEWWVLTPAMAAAVAAGVSVVVTVALTVPDTATEETKKLIGALSTGITGFITAAFISWTGDEKDSRLADHIRDVFRSKYKRAGSDQPPRPDVHYFRADSPGERWVYADEFGGQEGWGRAARLARAKGIAEELKSRGSEPTATR
jgi:hypothetical protein